jgi:hypothetical protein
MQRRLRTITANTVLLAVVLIANGAAAQDVYPGAEPTPIDPFGMTASSAPAATPRLTPAEMRQLSRRGRIRYRGFVPAGMSLVTERQTGMASAGAFIGLMSYSGAVAAGGMNRDAWYGLPIFGAFYAAATEFQAASRCTGFLSELCSGSDQLAGVFFIFDGVAQAAGAVIVGIAMARPRQWIVRDADAAIVARPARPAWIVLPTAPEAAAGLTAIATIM